MYVVRARSTKHGSGLKVSKYYSSESSKKNQTEIKTNGTDEYLGHANRVVLRILIMPRNIKSRIELLMHDSKMQSSLVLLIKIGGQVK